MIKYIRNYKFGETYGWIKVILKAYGIKPKGYIKPYLTRRKANLTLMVMSAAYLGW